MKFTIIPTSRFTTTKVVTVIKGTKNTQASGSTNITGITIHNDQKSKIMIKNK